MINVVHGRMMPVQHKIFPFTITMETLTSTLWALSTVFEDYKIFLRIKWLRQDKRHFNWATSTLVVSYEGVHHNIYPETVDQMIVVILFIVWCHKISVRFKSLVLAHQGWIKLDEETTWTSN